MRAHLYLLGLVLMPSSVALGVGSMFAAGRALSCVAAAMGLVGLLLAVAAESIHAPRVRRRRRRGELGR